VVLVDVLQARGAGLLLLAAAVDVLRAQGAGLLRLVALGAPELAAWPHGSPLQSSTQLHDLCHGLHELLVHVHELLRELGTANGGAGG
jgi:hypothetical protein